MFQKNKDKTIIGLGLVSLLLSTIFSCYIISLLYDTKQSSGK